MTLEYKRVFLCFCFYLSEEKRGEILTESRGSCSGLKMEHLQVLKSYCCPIFLMTTGGHYNLS